jgi:hypothetical protein
MMSNYQKSTIILFMNYLFFIVVLIVNMEIYCLIM